MYTKFELPNKKIKTMGKKGRKKSVNPKKTPKRKREPILQVAASSKREDRRRKFANSPTLKSNSQNSKNRATKSVIARSSPLHGPSRASLAWKSTQPVGAMTGTGYSQERQLGDAGSAVYTPPTPTG
jgi:hypothetical protein